MGIVRQPQISNHRMTTVPKVEGGTKGVALPEPGAGRLQGTKADHWVGVGTLQGRHH